MLQVSGSCTFAICFEVQEKGLLLPLLVLAEPLALLPPHLLEQVHSDTTLDWRCSRELVLQWSENTTVTLFSRVTFSHVHPAESRRSRQVDREYLWTIRLVWTLLRSSAGFMTAYITLVGFTQDKGTGKLPFTGRGTESLAQFETSALLELNVRQMTKYFGNL